MGEMRNAYRILVGKREEKRPLGRRMPRRENNIIADLMEIRFRTVDWIYLAQDRNWRRSLVNTVIILRVP
jgi:hypothetical protein